MSVQIQTDRPLVEFQDLGLISYADAWDKQTMFNTALKDAKRGSGPQIPNQLLFCEHPPVYTLGKSGSEANLKISDEERVNLDIEFFRINRGGDITFHGPGQVVAYPILDLDQFFTDAHKYVRSLEEVIIRTLAGVHRRMAGLERFTTQKDLRYWRSSESLGLNAWTGLECQHRTELLPAYRPMRN